MIDKVGIETAPKTTISIRIDITPTDILPLLQATLKPYKKIKQGEQPVKFTKSELELIYQYAGADKSKTLAGLKEIAPVIKDTMTRVIVEKTIAKPQKIPEPECSKFITDTKAYFFEERDNSIMRQLAAAKEQTKPPIWQ